MDSKVAEAALAGKSLSFSCSESNGTGEDDSLSGNILGC